MHLIRMSRGANQGQKIRKSVKRASKLHTDKNDKNPHKTTNCGHFRRLPHVSSDGS